jgi:hypothetical protein
MVRLYPLAEHVQKIPILIYLKVVRVRPGCKLIDIVAVRAFGFKHLLLAGCIPGLDLWRENVTIWTVSLDILGVVKNKTVCLSFIDTQATTNYLL